MRDHSAVAIVNAILPDRDGIAMHGQPPAGPRNRLADETSPYLLQHAANPVDWHPWGAAAIARARELDRPILLSIGYSACHWCHVMAHESFEDAATAAVMNRLFVNVKLDREERPDLDKVYQLAHQVLTQRGGGWPLTMFLAPDDLTPFFGGTYFPKEPRYGMPAFTDLIERVAAFYRDEREGVRSPERGAARRVRGPRAARRRSRRRAHARTARRRACRNLAATFDPRFGGFGPAPKFPHAASIELLLREPAGTDARSMAVADAAAHGGGRDLRPAGRRVLPLLGRSVLDDSALREDALRQRPAARALRAGGRRDRATTSCASAAIATADWALARNARAGGRLLRRARCGFRGPRGPLLRLAARGGRAPARRRRVSRARAPLRPRSRAEFRGRLAPARLRRHGPGGRGTGAAAGARSMPCSTPRARSSSPPARSASGPASTTRS